MGTRIITVSASYGAGGSVIAPTVASRLGMAFMDRALSDAASLARDPESATEDERTEGLLARILSSFAVGPDALAGAPGPLPGVRHDEALRQQAAARIEAFAAAGGGVILGWGAGLLAEGAFRVHLDGPPDARIRQAVRLGAIDPGLAKQRQGDTDHVRGLYSRRLYGKDWRDPSLYHLWLDSTAVPFETCAGLIVTAARSYWEACAAAHR